MNLLKIGLLVSTFIFTNCYSKHVVTIPISIDLEKLNPQQILNAESKTILSAIYNTLFEIQGTHPKPKLIHSWQYESNSKTLIFEIKNNVFFHNGQKLTSNDIIFSIYQWARRDALDSNLLTEIVGIEDYQAGRNSIISGISKLDLTKFAIQIKNSANNFVQTLCLPRFVVMPNNFGGMAAANYFEHPIGTGPFQFKELTTDTLTLNRFEKYFFGKPKSQTLIIKKMNFKNAINDFNNGKIDLLLFYSLVDAKSIIRKDVVIEVLPSTTSILLIFPQNVFDYTKIDYRMQIAKKVQSSQLLTECIVDPTQKGQFLPPGLLQVPGPLINPVVAPIGKINNKDKNMVTVSLTNDVWIRCFPQGEKQRLDQHLTYKTDEVGKLFAQFKQGKIGPTIETFSFKNDDAMSVLQYFDPTNTEFLLGKKLPELTSLFKKIKQSKTEVEKIEATKLIANFLVKNYYVVPLSNPKNIRVFGENISGVTQNSIFQQSQNWEGIGY